MKLILITIHYLFLGTLYDWVFLSTGSYLSVGSAVVTINSSSEFISKWSNSVDWTKCRHTTANLSDLISCASMDWNGTPQMSFINNFEINTVKYFYYWDLKSTWKYFSFIKLLQPIRMAKRRLTYHNIIINIDFTFTKLLVLCID